MNPQHALAPILFSGLIGLAGCSGQPTSTAATPSAPTGGSGCIETFRVDHTEIPDDKTILYHMKDGKIWKNTLPFACPSLKNEGGFVYESDFPEICSNERTIRVLRSGIICQLGQFTPYTPQ